ncbi:MAG: hypothetical protein H7325_01870, partial [Pedobacter sp.]|nr:hypothetical protein [Pedobacter sp.]
MKSRIIKFVLFVAFTAGFATSCVNSDEYPTPENSLVTYEFVATKSVLEIKTLSLLTGATPVLYGADDIIEGYVTSNDKESNFYNTISLQTIPTDGSQPIGFSITANFRA